MKMTTVCSVCLVMLAAFAATGTQLHASLPQAGVASSAISSSPTSQAFATQREHAASLETNDQDDPAYLAYKAAYKLIIEEKWDDARKRFAEVIGKYPKSKYVDDAQYWIAYSWKYSDRKKAIEVYKKFIKEYPTSSYYDDAIGDLSRLENRDAPPPGQPPREGFVVGQEKVEALARSAQEVARATQNIGRLSTGIPFKLKQELPELRVKIDALNALGRSKQDEKTFELLKEMALDKGQPSELRETALQLLANFKDRDVTDIYQQVIRDGSDRRVQQSAIHSFVRLGKEGDEKIFSVIKQIALDAKLDRELRESAFYALRATEMPGALDVFIDIAKKDPEEHVREIALYQIAQCAKMDEEKVFRVLKEFALDRDQPLEVRQNAFYTLQSMKKAEVLDLYYEIAKSDPDERIRASALYYIGEAGRKDTARVFRIYREVLLDQNQPKEMRRAAIYSLARLKHSDALNLLLQVAKTDPDEEMQQTAIYHIAQMSKSKEKSLATLVSLFDSMPKSRVQTLNGLIYSIAAIGNDEAVEFLGKVAKTNENYDLRRTAVYHLGNIGGDKARAVLYDILKEK